MTILSIDTTNSKAINLVLQIGNEKKAKTIEHPTPQADKVLTEISELLNENSKKPTDLDKIIVHRGPGSYTGIRVGLTIANTLASALGIPVNDKKVGEVETALYE